MEFAKRLARQLLPLQARHWLRNRVLGGRRLERILYESQALIGNDSPNAWIRKSADIGGWLFAGEHEYLWELATRSTAAGDIIEIGSWMGKSSCILAGACAEFAPETKVVCIDTFLMTGTAPQQAYHRRLVPNAPGTFYEFQDNASRLGFAKFVVPVAAHSAQALPRLRGPFRLAFIDGAHDRENCQRDVELCLALLASGGVLALHDAAGGGWPGVEEYVREELLPSPGLKYLGNRGTIAAFEKIAAPFPLSH